MTLQEQINRDLKEAMTDFKDKAYILNLRLIKAELSRLSNKVLTDDTVIKVLNKLKKNEQEVLSIKKEQDSGFLKVLNSYIPETTMLSEEEIIKWINNNIDFSTLKNSMQAVGIVCKHFGKQVDGSLVKDIVTNVYTIL